MKRQVLSQATGASYGVACAIALLLAAGCAGVQSRYHRVEKGESVSVLAKKYSVPEAEILRANADRLSGGLHPGQSIFIPFEQSPEWNQDINMVAAVVAEASDEDGARGVASTEGNSIQRVAFTWPVKGRLSSRFGRRTLRGRGPHRHEGIDIAAPRGTPVRAARGGHVIYASNRIRGYGRMVILQHPDQYSTVYAHLSRTNVAKGDYVPRGQVLGAVGRTGRTTGNHLHFEVRSQRRPVDPLPLLFEQVASKNQ